jgi:hypothetical protein
MLPQHHATSLPARAAAGVHMAAECPADPCMLAPLYALQAATCPSSQPAVCSSTHLQSCSLLAKAPQLQDRCSRVSRCEICKLSDHAVCCACLTTSSNGLSLCHFAHSHYAAHRKPEPPTPNRCLQHQQPSTIQCRYSAQSGQAHTQLTARARASHLAA